MSSLSYEGKRSQIMSRVNSIMETHGVGHVSQQHSARFDVGVGNINHLNEKHDKLQASYSGGRRRDPACSPKTPTYSDLVKPDLSVGIYQNRVKQDIDESANRIEQMLNQSGLYAEALAKEHGNRKDLFDSRGSFGNDHNLTSSFAKPSNQKTVRF